MKGNKQVIVEAPVLVLVGPTAIGKTSLSLELADRFDCEIISVDSMQVYRYMDIGTAKPSALEQGRVRHHLLDVVDPDEQFDAAQFVRLATKAVDTIISAGKIPFLTGGTGLYLKALLYGLFDLEGISDDTVRQDLARRLEEKGNLNLFAWLKDVDPQTAARIHPNDTQRLLRALEIYQVSGIPWSQHLQNQQSPPVQFSKILQLGLTCDRELLYGRIEKRTELMMQQGLIQEVKRLREMGYSAELASMQSIGYRHANNCIDGVWSMDDAVRLLKRDTRRYAKRQLTWFANDRSIQWYDRNEREKVLDTVEIFLND